MNKTKRIRTPPVRPNILSRSGGVRISLPITLPLNPGAYCSMMSNTENKTKKAYSLSVIEVYKFCHFFANTLTENCDIIS